MTSALWRIPGRFVGFGGITATLTSAPADGVLSRVTAAPADLTPTVGAGVPARPGLGTASDPEQARLAALGEMIERHATFHIARERMRIASVVEHRAAGRAHVAPSAFVHLAPGQYDDPRLGLAPPPDDHDPVPWLPGVNLLTGAETWVPAEVCVNEFVDATGRWWTAPPWFAATSNGGAAGADPIRATLAGLLELAERDAFMLTWLHRWQLPHLDVAGAGPVGRALARMTARPRITCRLIDLSDVHDIPTVLAVAHGRPGGRSVYGFGAAAGVHLQRAALKAATEAVTAYSRLRLLAATDRTPRLEADDLIGFGPHGLYYLDPDHQDALAFLLDPPQVRRLGGHGTVEEPAATLRRTVRRLADRGIDTYTVDVTSVEAEDLGLAVCKVVSPQALPLDADHVGRPLAHPRRLTEPPLARPGTGRRAAPGLNDAPHPLT